MDLISLVLLAGVRGASDVHLVASQTPVFRIHGLLQPMTDMPLLTDNDINEAFQQITSEKERDSFERHLELDHSYTVPSLGRIRCNAAKQRGTISLTIRLIPQVIPAIQELGLPEVCKDLIIKPRGLVIVSGPTGCGKSTTLSAMINYLNSVQSRRVVTIEDPIEFFYSDDKCTITQRELGHDTLSFSEALKHVVRQNPDVILVGEVRDLETAAAVLAVAETGHLVLTTGHAMSAYQAIERMVDLFPPHERPLAQSRLASLLIGILCQALVPKLDGSGRVVAVEIMLANPAIRNLIREGKIYQLPNAMLTSAESGMVLFDSALVNLYRKRLISLENLFAFCNDQDEVSKLLGNMS